MSLPGTYLPDSNLNAAQMQTSEYGYGVGGWTGLTYKSIIFRVDFNTETSTDITETMPDYYHDGSATQSDSYGYVVGGRIEQMIVLAFVDLILLQKHSVLFQQLQKKYHEFLVSLKIPTVLLCREDWLVLELVIYPN